MQQILVLVVFIGALAYLAKLIYNHLTIQSNCSTGCGKCNSIDIKKIEEQFKADSLRN